MMVGPAWLRAIKRLTQIYLAVVVLAAIAGLVLAVVPGNGPKGPDYVGCYAAKSFLSYYTCRGFVGHEIVELWLHLPYLMLFILPLAAIAIFDSTVGLARKLELVLIALIVWLPIVALAYTSLKLKSPNRS